MKYNKNLEHMSEYVLSDRINIEQDEYIKLDWNELTTQPNSNLYLDLINLLKTEEFYSYPDVAARKLKEMLANYVGQHVSNVQIFNGSDSALRDIFATFVYNGTKVLLYEPTYTQVKPFIQMMGGNIIISQIKNIFGTHDYNFEDIEKADIIYIVNPNNPTGFVLEKNVILELVKKYNDKIFIIDEAYYEFSNISLVDEVNNYENLIITRTFSKAFGLAGVRLGYIITNNKLLSLINKVHNVKEVNTIAQASGISSLNNIEDIKKYCSYVNQVREYFISELLKRKIEVADSKSNFVLIKLENANNLVEILKRKKILIRDRSNLTNLKNCVRITIGTMEQMNQILDVLTVVTK